MNFSARLNWDVVSDIPIPSSEFEAAECLFREEHYEDSLRVLDRILVPNVSVVEITLVSADEYLALYGWNLFFLKDLDVLDAFFENLGDIDFDLLPKLNLVRLRGLDQRDRSDVVIEACERYIAQHRDPIDPLVADFLFAKGMSNYRLGNATDAIRDLEISYSLFDFRQEPFGMGRSGNYLGFVHLRTANYPESLNWFAKTLASYENLRLLQKQSMVLLNKGIAHYKTGEFDKSLDCLTRSHQIGVDGEWAHRQVFTNIALGNVYRICHEYDTARKHLHTGYSQAQSLGFPREEALALEFLGDVYRDEGQIRDAYRFYLRAQMIAKEIAPKGDIVMEVHRRIGECHLAEGDPTEALAALRCGLALSRAQSDRFEEAVILRVMAKVSLTVSDLSHAAKNAEKSAEILRRIGARHEQAISELMWVDILVAEYEKGARGQRAGKLLDEAWDLSRSALDLSLECGVRHWVDKARQMVNRVSGLRSERSASNEKISLELSAEFRAPRNVIIHTSAVMRDLLQLCDVYADTSEPVLITGETGTGKELIARRIHSSSRRAGQEMVAVNVSAIPADLFEREFFGHVKGAYSGADRDGDGFAGRADGSTLFLDEIGDLPLSVQPKLLRLLQDGAYQSLGDPGQRTADLRLIAATNADLGQLVREGRFRADLYYRLKILELEIPAVHKRPEDILLLLRHFLSQAAGRPVDLAHYFDQPSLDRILAYRWPGNVREIAMVARRAAVEMEAKKRVELDLVDEGGERIRLSGPTPKTLAAMAAESGNPFDGIMASSHSVERSRLLLALEECGGSKTVAARRLGISRSTLYRKMRRLEIQSDQS